MVEASCLKCIIKCRLFVHFTKEDVILDCSGDDERFLLYIGNCATHLFGSSLYLRFIHDGVKQGRLTSANLPNDDQELLWLKFEGNILNDGLIILFH